MSSVLRLEGEGFAQPPRGERREVVLVVDDNDANRYAVAHWLRSAGLEPIEAATGEEALQRAWDEAGPRPDLVILDVRLPDTTGFEVLRTLKADSRTSEVPVLHLSASFTATEWRAHGLELGADAFLTHPVEPRELLATVRALLRVRRAEARVRHAAAHWQATFDAIGDAIVLLDEAGNVIQLNGAATRLFGRAAADLIGEPLSLVIEQTLGTPAQWPVALSQPTRRSEKHELHVGARRFEITVHPVGDDESSEAVCVLADVTERIHHQEAVESSELRYRALVMASAQVVWITDPAGRVHLEMPSWGEYTGQTFEQYGGIGWLDAVHPADREKVQRTWQEAVAQQRGYESEYRLLRHDGSYRHVVARGVPVLGTDGRLREWVGTCTDVTERRRHEMAERLLSESTTALATLLDSEMMLARLVELSLPALGDWCSIALVDDEQQVRRSASAHLDPERAQTARDLRRLYDDQQGHPAEHPHARAVRQGASSLVSQVSPETLARIAIDDRHRAMLETLRLRSLIGVPLLARGRVVGALLCGSGEGRRLDGFDLATAQELARRAALALDNAQLYEAAVIANEAKADFLAVMSHELRTPLNAIIGYADLLTSGVMGELTGTQTQSVERLKRSGQHLLSLIDEVLTYSRLEAGKEIVEPQPADVTGIMGDVVTLMEPLAADRALLFDVTMPSESVIAEVDPRRLRQILINLLSNAIKFTESGAVTLEFVPERATHRLLFRVRDTGIGIAADHLERVFEPFWQVQQKATRRAGGTGLGLSVVRRLARLMGGDVVAESVVG
ncbi:MAG TPA: PAS domain S-box protein, partial [Gemmatimonadaceae bacterium]|nr:PAS domain S-box protein [Gemmatimonadaceae bacterium]